MKVSVIMAACNQGSYLGETIESAIVGLEGCKDYEILVIDDHSTDGCCDGIDRYQHVTLFRPEQKMGVSCARHMAGEMVNGDVIITTDTHVNFNKRSLHRLSYWASRLRAVIMPATDFELDDGKVARIMGGALSLSSRGLRIDRPRKPRKFTSMFGSVYVMRRDVWDWLGGWLRLPGYWGGEETAMTLAAYRLGVPIKLVDKHVTFHRRYRKHNVYPYDLPSQHVADIAHYIHAGFLPNAYERALKNQLKMFYGDKITCDPKILTDWVENRAVWSEQRTIQTLLGVKDITQHPVIINLANRLKRITS